MKIELCLIGDLRTPHYTEAAGARSLERLGHNQRRKCPIKKKKGKKKKSTNGYCGILLLLGNFFKSWDSYAHYYYYY